MFNINIDEDEARELLDELWNLHVDISKREIFYDLQRVV